MLQKVRFKKTYVTVILLEVLLVIAILGWNYFKDRKMGMVRHITFRNIYKFPKYFTPTNINLILTFLVILLIVQLILVIIYKKFIIQFVINLILVIGSIFYILKNNVDINFIYYYIVIFFVLFNVLRFLQFLTLRFK